jgi:hypothetical protein
MIEDLAPPAPLVSGLVHGEHGGRTLKDLFRRGSFSD